MFFFFFYFKPFFFFLHRTTLMGFYSLFMYLALWSSVPKYSIFHHTALVQPLQIDHFLSLQNLVISGILGVLSRPLCINFLIRSQSHFSYAFVTLKFIPKIGPRKYAIIIRREGG